MPRTCLDIARDHGLLPVLMSLHITEIVTAEPRILADDASLGARLLSLGYSKGEIDMRLFASSQGTTTARAA
ncbi:hypothetical protein SAMN02745157_1438 [Kaistia soli DSM 19436]|uniref:Uncharacterized protein n=1 Tax=Kaistia soli DSM 19436 TaxID=1122133 RepID=A0A1M4Y6R5_9HYPH|nr:hypothetical protein [Kaistia soli]SHF01316.1 hypothetical protein SAMN02745157_1438 [Kaistia soli DSM 19436]